MVELMELAYGREIHLSLDLNEEPIKGNDVDDQPTLIVKLPQACENVQLLSKFGLEHPSKFSVVIYVILSFVV